MTKWMNKYFRADQTTWLRHGSMLWNPHVAAEILNHIDPKVVRQAIIDADVAPEYVGDDWLNDEAKRAWKAVYRGSCE